MVLNLDCKHCGSEGNQAPFCSSQAKHADACGPERTCQDDKLDDEVYLCNVLLYMVDAGS
eukprot:6475952-Amphidinium_carterae.1